MMSNKLNFLLRQFYRGPAWNCRFCSTVPPTAGNEKDLAPMFFDERVQQLLVTLTRINYERIFAPRRDGTPLTSPTYKFMTDEELKEAKLEVEKKARGRIQMPPVVNPRDDTDLVLSKDYAIQGFDNTKYVFTDISFGGTNRHRVIVVREPSGILRRANTDERHRMNQVYFPIKDRELHTPKMFTNPHFSELLEKEEFEFILDRACLQYDPDHSEYHRITKAVYSRVQEWKKFDALRSTRHFGPLVFHLASEKNIEALLEDVIKNGKIEEGAALVELYHCLHPEAQSAGKPTQNDIELIRLYAELDSSDRYGIERALETYEHIQAEKKQLQERIEQGHHVAEETDQSDQPKT
nr:28S ribosomal protein S22, mitochondrial [Osmia lignaria]